MIINLSLNLNRIFYANFVMVHGVWLCCGVKKRKHKFKFKFYIYSFKVMVKLVFKKIVINQDQISEPAMSKCNKTKILIVDTIASYNANQPIGTKGTSAPISI